MKGICYFDPLNKFYKSVRGAIKEGKKVTLRVKGDFFSVDFVWHKDGENDKILPMEKVDNYFETTLDFPVGIFWYAFRVNRDKYIGCDSNITGIITDFPDYFQLSVYSRNYNVPFLLNGGIIYQIFPDRFNRSSDFDINKNFGRFIHADTKDDPIFMPNENGKVLNNDFFGGNIKGITEKLDYLKTLNVTAIYLNPVFKAFSNHRYDTGDFMEIDPLLGTERDFRELINKAKEKGISIIIDGVFNHVGADSLYFNKYGTYKVTGAYQSESSKYYRWFNFIDYPDEYESWWGIDTLPQVNEKNADYVDFICGNNGVLQKYFNMGVGGIRLDVVDELPDEFVKKIRERVKKIDRNNVIIGEVWEDASNKTSYGVRREYFLGHELDSVMNYPLKNAIIDFVKSGDPNGLSRTVRTIIDHYPKNVCDTLMNILSTHDTARILSAVSDEEYAGKSKTELSKLTVKDKETAKFRLKAAVLLQYSLFGVPCIYYGDEAGADGFFDPLNRRFFSWDDIDTEIFDFYKKMGEIRKSMGVFSSGEFRELYKGYGFYSFIREDKNEDVLIIVNVKNKEYCVKFSGEITEILTGITYRNQINVQKNFIGIFKKS